MYMIQLSKEGLQPGTGQKSDVKLYLTDAVTNWTGEVNSYVNEARRMRNTIKYCQQVTLDIVDNMSLRRGDTVTVRLQSHGYTISILTRDGLREPNASCRSAPKDITPEYPEKSNQASVDHFLVSLKEVQHPGKHSDHGLNVTKERQGWHCRT